MPRLKCSDNVPPHQRQKPGNCFKLGFKVGYAVSKNTHPPLLSLTLRQLGDYARRYAIPRYSRMTKNELILALRNKNYPRGI